MNTGTNSSTLFRQLLLMRSHLMNDSIWIKRETVFTTLDARSPMPSSMLPCSPLGTGFFETLLCLQRAQWSITITQSRTRRTPVLSCPCIFASPFAVPCLAKSVLGRGAVALPTELAVQSLRQVVNTLSLDRAENLEL